MSETIHPLPASVAQSMLQGVVWSLCDRPGDTPAQRDARSRDVVHTVLSLGPRDPVEIMCASMIVAHFHLLLDGARAILHDPEGTTKPRARSTVVAMDRVWFAYLKELRTAQQRLAPADAGGTGDTADRGGAGPAAQSPPARQNAAGPQPHAPSPGPKVTAEKPPAAPAEEHQPSGARLSAPPSHEPPSGAWPIVAAPTGPGGRPATTRTGAAAPGKVDGASAPRSPAPIPSTAACAVRVPPKAVADGTALASLAPYIPPRAGTLISAGAMKAAMTMPADARFVVTPPGGPALR